jgi:hypothetical protein
MKIYTKDKPPLCGWEWYEEHLNSATPLSQKMEIFIDNSYTPCMTLYTGLKFPKGELKRIFKALKNKVCPQS